MLLTLTPTSVLASEIGSEVEQSGIVYETHPGIGSIEDILLLPNTFGLRPGEAYDGSYYNQ